MIDFAFVTTRLATGAGINSADDVSALVSARIHAVIDCRDDFDDGALLARHPEVAYLWNPTADDGQPKPTSWFQRSLDFALPLFAKPNMRVYCHCAAGINRGPSTAYAIMLALGWVGVFALNQIRLKRPQCVVGIRYSDDAERAVKELGYVQ